MGLVSIAHWICFKYTAALAALETLAALSALAALAALAALDDTPEALCGYGENRLKSTGCGARGGAGATLLIINIKIMLYTAFTNTFKT